MIRYILIGLCLSIVGISASPVLAAEETREIVFPVIGSTSFINDFDQPRPTGTMVHEATDIFGAKGMPLIAAVDGTVEFVAWPEPDYGFLVSIQDVEGYRYRYIHVNNDTPGTDDGAGIGRFAYAPGIEEGAPVTQGQLIGWMGDSGLAEDTPPHLHFEIFAPDRHPLNPYFSLLEAEHLSAPITAPKLSDELLPFGEFTGGANIALGNFDQDSTDLELAVGAGPGGGPNLRIVEQTGGVISGFFAFDSALRGGIDVAAADINQDGVDEIITSQGPGGEPSVRVFDADGTLVSEFLAYDAGFRGGVRISAGDLDGDGVAEIVAGAGPGGGPHVRVFDAEGTLLYSFFAYDPNFRGGIDVAVKPHRPNRPGKIVTGAGPGGGPHVRVFLPNGTAVSNFFAYAPTFRGGVKVSVGDALTESTRLEISTAPASLGSADVRVFRVKTGELEAYGPSAFEEWWTGGYDIVSEDGITCLSSLDGRRATVRIVDL